MNTRRKFLLQGSLATTALLTAKPFKTLANALAPITGYAINDNTIVLVHTGAYNNNATQQTIQQITDLKRNTGNLVLLHAGHDHAAQLNYDASMNMEACVSITTDNYKIIYKGNIKIGVITASASKKDTFEKVNALSVYLKKEKNCQVVVCLSQLGYKNKTSIDDINLANSSTDLDVIIGGHTKNFSAHPVIVQSSKKGEVIIHSDTGNGFAFRNIEISFDEKRKKRSIAINNLVSRKAATA